MQVKSDEVRLKGAPICRGIAIGKPFFFTLQEDQFPEFAIPKKDVEEEVQRYRDAIKRSKADVKKLQEKLKKECVLEGAQILDTHFALMQDPLLTEEIEKSIREERKNAEHVFQAAVSQLQKKFQ